MSLFGSVADAPLKRGGARRGVAMYISEKALGSGVAAFATPFRTVLSAQATIKGSAAPGVATSIVTVSWAANVVTVSGWKVTSSSVTTLIAATNTEVVEVAVFGIY